MMTSPLHLSDIATIDHRQVEGIAGTENRRIGDLLGDLEPAGWSMATDCPDWDVRAMSAHVLGAMETFDAFRHVARMMAGAQRAGRDAPLEDRLSALQVRQRRELSRAQVLERLRAAGPRSARWRGRLAATVRRLPMGAVDVGGVTETWSIGYLTDLVLTRDTWMHRVDISRAVGRPMVLTADHDGLIVADVVADWAHRHGMPFRLHLSGTAGGSFGVGSAPTVLEFDAVEFCRQLSGRGSGKPPLGQYVPF